MGKFISYDGRDKDNVRAEVSVQVGSGRVKELVNRGNPSPDGSYRNIEVVFDPDNPLLKRKVYALLDTTAKDLWEYVQAAHKDQRTVNYRIESQRKRGVERKTPFVDLKHTEEVVRILAALDNVFSHEAKTDPREDPTGENPSALQQRLEGKNTNSVEQNDNVVSTLDPVVVLKAVENAQRHNQERVVDALFAQALLAGVAADELFGAKNNVPDYGSKMVAHAAKAEQFALDHLVAFYAATSGAPRAKTVPVQVTDSMVSQAASLALTLLDIADMVQAKACGSVHDRRAPSYERALSLVLDGIDKRYSFPIGENEQAIADWREKVTIEAAERLYGIGSVAYGVLPSSENVEKINAGESIVEPVEANIVVETVLEEPPVSHIEEEPEEVLSVQEVAEMFNAAPVAPAPFVPNSMVSETSADFVTPSDELVARVRDMCIAAGVTTDPHAISDWLERLLGVRTARKVHADTLEEFVSYYEKAGAEQVRAEVLGS